MVQSRGERLSIWAPASAPLTDSEADARSAPRPTRTAESSTGLASGTCELFSGAMVRTIGGAATTEGEGAGLTLTPGDGRGCSATAGDGDGRARSASLGTSVGGTPGGVGGRVPGTAPRSGRSFAGAHAVARVASRRSWRRRR